MHLNTTDAVTPQEKEELLTGLRTYNGQFLDLSTFSGDIGVYVRDDKGVMLGGLIGVRKGDWLNIEYLLGQRRRAGLGRRQPAYQNGRGRSPTQRLHPRAGGYGQLPGAPVL